jgi:hypothetical protein
LGRLRGRPTSARNNEHDRLAAALRIRAASRFVFFEFRVAGSGLIFDPGYLPLDSRVVAAENETRPPSPFTGKPAVNKRIFATELTAVVLYSVASLVVIQVIAAWKTGELDSYLNVTYVFPWQIRLLAAAIFLPVIFLGFVHHLRNLRYVIHGQEPTPIRFRFSMRGLLVAFTLIAIELWAIGLALRN